MKKAFIVNGGYSDADVLRPLMPIANLKELLDHPDHIGLVLFTGGEDISPELYGHRNVESWNNPQRDKVEKSAFEYCRMHHIPMAGICRGAQLLTALSGGWLFQHVNNHAGRSHLMKTSDDQVVPVNSLHHQMCVPPEGSILLGWAAERLSDKYIDQDGEAPVERWPEREAEAMWIPATQSLGVQYHPEFMQDLSAPGVKWFHKMLNKYILNNHEE